MKTSTTCKYDQKQDIFEQFQTILAQSPEQQQRISAHKKMARSEVDEMRHKEGTHQLRKLYIKVHVQHYSRLYSSTVTAVHLYIREIFFYFCMHFVTARISHDIL